MREAARGHGYRIWRADGNREECQLCKFRRRAKWNRKKRKKHRGGLTGLFGDFLIS